MNHSVNIIRNSNGFATVVTDPINRTAKLSYDEKGRQTSLTDGANKTTAFQFDTDGGLTQIQDTANGLTKLAYSKGLLDSAELLQSITDPNNHASTFGYDTRSRLASATNGVGQTRTIQYDDSNRVTEVTRPDGTQISFSYDNLGRLIRKSMPNDTLTIGYDAAGNVTSMENNASLIQFTYDIVSRPVRALATNKKTNSSSEVDYTYDANGNRTRISLAASPAPYVWSYAYDSLNRLTSITTPAQKIFTLQYDALSRRTRLNYPNGIEAVYSYDDASQLLSINHRRTSDQVMISSAVFSYDLAGNRILYQDLWGNHTFTYDNLDRLTSGSHPSASGLANESFSYDSAGNRTSDSKRTTYHYDAANRELDDSQAAFAFDSNGNNTQRTRKSDGTTTNYHYDSDDQLILVDLPDGAHVSFAYDPLGRRISKTYSSVAGSTSTWFIYDGAQLLAEQSLTSGSLALFTNGINNAEALQYFSSSDGDHFLHATHLGSVVAITDSNGQISSRIQYDSFGNIYVDSATLSIFSGEIGGFAGMRYDFETGLYYARTRYYDPDRGYYLSEDILLKSGRPNLYSYVYNRPQSLKDPGGTYAIIDDATFAAAGALGGVIGQAVADIARGHLSGPEDYLGSYIGGAVGGLTLLYGWNPYLSGAINGTVSNFAKQRLKIWTGEQCDFDLKSLAFDTGAGLVLGGLTGDALPGINSGRNSDLAIAKSMVTKIERGQISRISSQTVGKMLLGKGQEGALLQSSVIGGVTGNYGPELPPNCKCQKGGE